MTDRRFREYASLDLPSTAGRLAEKARTKNVAFCTRALRYFATTFARAAASLLFGIKPTIESAWPSTRIDNCVEFFNFATNPLKTFLEALSKMAEFGAK
jgi:hypothetical protein